MNRQSACVRQINRTKRSQSNWKTSPSNINRKKGSRQCCNPLGWSPGTISSPQRLLSWYQLNHLFSAPVIFISLMPWKYIAMICHHPSSFARNSLVGRWNGFQFQNLTDHLLVPQQQSCAAETNSTTYSYFSKLHALGVWLHVSARGPPHVFYVHCTYT